MRVLFTMLLMFSSIAAFADAYGPARSELEKFSNGLETLQVDFTQVVKSQDGRIQDKTYGSAPFELNAGSSSGLGVTYESSNPDVVTVNGDTVTILQCRFHY